MWNNTFEVALPSPTTQSGTFTVSTPVAGAISNIAVRSDNVYLQFLMQTSGAVAIPPVQSQTYRYRAIPQSWNDTTVTQLENFIGFVNLSTGAYVLTLIQALA